MTTLEIVLSIGYGLLVPPFAWMFVMVLKINRQVERFDVALYGEKGENGMSREVKNLREDRHEFARKVTTNMAEQWNEYERRIAEIERSHGPRRRVE